MIDDFINSAEVKKHKGNRNQAFGIRRSDLDPNVLGTLIKIEQNDPFSIFPLAQEKQIEKENNNENKEDYRRKEICK